MHLKSNALEDIDQISKGVDKVPCNKKDIKEVDSMNNKCEDVPSKPDKKDLGFKLKKSTNSKTEDQSKEKKKKKSFCSILWSTRVSGMLIRKRVKDNLCYDFPIFLDI